MLLLLCLFCVLPVIRVFADDEVEVDGEKQTENPPDTPLRFVVEDNFKSAIFGSHIYDPIRQVFDVQIRNETDHKKSKSSNHSHFLSTAVGGVDVLNTTTAALEDTPAMRSPRPIRGHLNDNIFRNLLAANTVSTPRSRFKKDPTKDLSKSFVVEKLKNMRDMDEAKKLLLSLNSKGPKSYLLRTK